MMPDFKRFRGLGIGMLLHSAKGSTWDDHKYIKRIDGTYYYPEGYEGGRHLPSGSDKKDKKDEEEMEDWEKKIYEGLKKSSNAIDAAKYEFGDLLAKYSGLDLSKLSKDEVDKMQRKIVGNLEKEKASKVNLSKNDIENLAQETVRGNFGNGQERKDLLGANYQEVQDRVNEIVKEMSGSKKISETSKEDKESGEKAVDKVMTSTTAKMDLETVYDVYRKKK